MINNSIHINNVETNEIVVREMTDEEQALKDAEIAAFQVEIQARKAKEQSDATAKAALLAQLGITAEQAKLLLS